MDLAPLQETLRTVVRDALSLTDVAAYEGSTWGDSAAGGTFSRPGQPRVRLIFRLLPALGQDEVHYDYDAGEDKLLPVVCGPRQLWVSVRIESQAQTPGGDAMYYAARLASRLRWPRLAALLDAGGLAVAEIRDPVNQSYVQDGRQLSLAVLDLVCHTAENDTDQSAGGEYFNKVKASGDPDTDLEIIPESTIGPPP